MSRPTPETDNVAQPSNLLQYETVNANFARKLERERDELRQWKKEMLLIESQWDEQIVGRLLGLQLGDYIKPNIEPKLRQLIRERDEAREQYDQICSQTLIEINKVCDERDEARQALSKIDEIFCDGEDTHDDWMKMGIIAKDYLKGLE